MAREEIPPGFGASAVTFGNFDGVHRGHQAVLGRVVDRARDLGLRALAVTFDPHPSALHRPDSPVEPIMSLDQRLDAMQATGLDGVLTIAYTPEFAATTPQDFVSGYLADALAARLVVVGEDVRFGRGNSGDVATLTGLGQEAGFDVEVIRDLGEPEGARRPRWSSTGVRPLLADGDVEEAARVLGRAHRVTGEVVHGDARGRTLGFPTANLGGRLDGMIPADGVYAGWLTPLSFPPSRPDPPQTPVSLSAQPSLRPLPAAISVGSNPTFAGSGRRVEAHVPHRQDLDLYGARIAVDFVARLRRTLAFATPQALTTQMHDDVCAALAVLRASWL
jgi:riboflavin kinase/FMN adenylyltransferase